MSELQSDAAAWTDRRMRLAREWDGLVERVRRLGRTHGDLRLEEFLRAPRLSALLPVARYGPVVVLNISRWRCDAIVVQVDGVHVLPLEGLTASDVEYWTTRHLGQLAAGEEAAGELAAARSDFHGGNRSPAAFRRSTAARDAMLHARNDMDAGLRTTTAWLWDRIAGPVLDALGFDGPPAPATTYPRLWWCPTGLLSLLPVHAAGHHDRPADGQKPPRTVLDRVASSYTPTLRALWEARNAGPHAGLGRVLYVAPDTPDQPRLRGSAAERDVLTVRFGDRLTCAENEKATRAAVQAGMLRHRWAHFSCHGGQELADPARGGLLLRDGLLTVRDLGQASFRGEFAFLAACKTATGGLVLSDEAITLTAALHYAGFQHVVGTLWSVSDLAASRIAAALYEELADDGTLHADRSARALHQAVRQLRSVDADDVAAWMPFTHTGP